MACPPHQWTEIGGIRTCLKCGSTQPGGGKIPKPRK